MRENITYRLTPSGTQQFADLQAVAESFGHKIHPHPNVSTFAHYRGQQLFGYSDHVFMPTCYPAWHPDFTKPRDIIDVMAHWKAHCELSGKIGCLAVPFNNDDGKGNFSEEVMQTIGLQRLKRELYLPI